MNGRYRDRNIDKKLPRDITLFPDFFKAYPELIPRLKKKKDLISKIYLFELEPTKKILEIDRISDPYFNLLLQLQKAEISKSLFLFKKIIKACQKEPQLRALFFRALIGIAEFFWQKGGKKEAIYYLKEAQLLLPRMFHFPSLRRYYHLLYKVNKGSGHLMDAEKALNFANNYII